jgi:hypothetical protein
MSDEPRRISVEPPVLKPITPGECDTGRPRCGKPARLFPAGWRCVDHAPAAMAARHNTTS